MKMWCEKHNKYFHIQDWACPECSKEDVLLDGLRERLIEQLINRFPKADDDEFWNSEDRINAVIRESFEHVPVSQSEHTCMYYYDHKRKVLDVSLVKSMDTIKIPVDTP